MSLIISTEEAFFIGDITNESDGQRVAPLASQMSVGTDDPGTGFVSGTVPGSEAEDSSAGTQKTALESEAENFLNALFGSYKGAIRFVDTDDYVIESTEVPELPNLAVCASTEDKTFFVFGIKPDAKRDDYKESEPAPSAALFKDGSLLLIWAFEEPIAKNDPRLIALADSMSMELDEAVPMPGTNGWELVYVDSSIYHTFDTLYEAYGPLPEEGEPVMYGNAKVLRPYNPEDYEKYSITVTLGGKRDSKQWNPKTMLLPELVGMLVKHKEGQKDGPAVVYADMVPGQRVKTAVKALTAVGLDIDTGTPSAVIDDALKTLGCFALRYTTHSHNKTESEFKRDKVVKFAQDEEIDTDLMKRFIRENEKWDDSIIETVEFDREEQMSGGMMVFVTHRPMPKHRVIIPFSAAFEIAKEGKTQLEAMAKWAKVPEAVAHKLGVPFDKTGTDPSRLFYLPRHAKGRSFEITLFGGPLFDWNSLSLFGEFDNIADDIEKKGSKSVTPEGRALGKWFRDNANGFQIMDVIEEYAPDKVRTPATNGYNICCPFDEDHSNAGDPDDVACFAVNAADGANEIYIVSCRHESCRDKTMLDMVGKMVKDGWFERKVLDDEQYNIVESSTTGESTKEKPGKDQSDPEASIREQITKLTKPAPSAEVKVIICGIANLDDLVAISNLKGALKSKTGMKIPEIEAAIRKEKSATAKKPAQRDSEGRFIFGHTGKLDDADAITALDTEIKQRNQKGSGAATPQYTTLLGEVNSLRKEDGRELFVSLGEKEFRAEVAQIAMTRYHGDNGPEAKKIMPTEVVDAVYHTFYRRVPETPTLIDTPIIAPDGSVLSKPGWHYDPKNNVNVYMRQTALKVPEVSKRPDADELRSAVEWVTDIVREFRFLDAKPDGTKDSESSRANAIGMIVTQFGRPLFDGLVPFFLIEKPTRNCGATLLSTIPEIILNGVEGSDTKYTPNESEMGKRLVTVFLEKPQVIRFDNVRNFNNAELLIAATARMLSGRILGINKSAKCDNDFLWIVTGISVTLSEEMARRLCWVKIDPQVSDPKTIKYSRDLKDWVKTHRAQIVWSILTMIQHWINSGRPDFKGDPMSSFEQWSKVVGGILESCEIKGFLGNERKASIDSRDTELRMFARDLYSEINHDEVRFETVRKWSLDFGPDILGGLNDAAKGKELLKALNELDEKTFPFGAGHEVQFHVIVDDSTGDVSYAFRKTNMAPVVKEVESVR